MFRNWATTIVFAPALFEIFTKLRAYFIFSTVVAISVACILSSYNKVLLLLSMISLGGFLAVHLYSSFGKAYRSNVFSKLHSIISEIKIGINDSNVFDKKFIEIKNEDVSTNKHKDVESKISALYFFYWIVAILNDKVSYILKSRKIDFYLISTWFWTVFVTVMIYSFEYLALYKIVPNSFNIPFRPSYFSFLGFSFGKLAPSGFSVISPNNLPATLLCYSEVACTFIVFIILVFTILTAARERYKEDIYCIVNDIAEIAVGAQDKFNTLFNLALSDVEYILLAENESLVNGLRKLRGLPELANSELNQSKFLLAKAVKHLEEPNHANSADAKNSAAD